MMIILCYVFLCIIMYSLRYFNMTLNSDFLLGSKAIFVHMDLGVHPLQDGSLLTDRGCHLLSPDTDRHQCRKVRQIHLLWYITIMQGKTFDFSLLNSRHNNWLKRLLLLKLQCFALSTSWYLDWILMQANHACCSLWP